jgi:hypothetical protein
MHTIQRRLHAEMRDVDRQPHCPSVCRIATASVTASVEAPLDAWIPCGKLPSRARSPLILGRPNCQRGYSLIGRGDAPIYSVAREKNLGGGTRSVLSQMPDHRPLWICGFRGEPPIRPKEWEASAPPDRTRSRAEGDTRSAANQVLPQESRSSRHRARGNPEGASVSSDRGAQGGHRAGHLRLPPDRGRPRRGSAEPPSRAVLPSSRMDPFARTPTRWRRPGRRRGAGRRQT